MRILIVADNNGIGHVKPFQKGDNHAGEAFWIADKKFTVAKDNRIKLGRQFMEKYGYTRSDGRRALIIDTGIWKYQPQHVYDDQIEQLGMVRKNGMYYVRGGRIESGRAFEPYYQQENGSRIPMDVGLLGNVYGKLISV